MIGDDDDDDQSHDDDTGPLVSEQPTIDAASRQTLKRRIKQIDIETQNKQNFWRKVFADPVGRREMWRILQEHGTFTDNFACGPTGFPNPEATWFAAGQKGIGLRMYHEWIILDRDGVFQMHDENDSRFQQPAAAKRRKPT